MSLASGGERDVSTVRGPDWRELIGSIEGESRPQSAHGADDPDVTGVLGVSEADRGPQPVRGQAQVPVRQPLVEDGRLVAV